MNALDNNLRDSPKCRNGNADGRARSRSLRDQLFDFAQGVNQRTAWLDRLKTRLGLTSFVERLLRPVPAGEIADSLVSALNRHVVSDRVRELTEQGVERVDFYILLVQSLGDIVACEPIPRYLKSIAPKSRVHWILLKPFGELIEDNPDVDDVVAVSSLAEGKAICSEKAQSPGAVVVDCHFDGTSCAKTRTVFRNRVNPAVNACTYYALGTLIDAFTAAAGLPRIEDAPRFHFGPDVVAPDGLPMRYAVFHCGSNEPCRNWQTVRWLELACLMRAKGLLVVEIGTERMLGQDPCIRDLTGRRSLQQLALVIRKAAVFVGVDSVFAHVANAVRTPTVALLGKYRAFETYMPYSGDFSRSSQFVVVRAPRSQPAAAIVVTEVLAATESVQGVSHRIVS